VCVCSVKNYTIESAQKR